MSESGMVEDSEGEDIFGLGNVPIPEVRHTPMLDAVNEKILEDKPDTPQRYGRVFQRGRGGRPSKASVLETEDEVSRVFVPRKKLLCWIEQDVVDYAAQLSVESPLNSREQDDLRKIRRQVLNRIASQHNREKKRQQREEIDGLIFSLRESNAALREELAAVKAQLEALNRGNGKSKHREKKSQHSLPEPKRAPKRIKTVNSESDE